MASLFRVRARLAPAVPLRSSQYTGEDHEPAAHPVDQCQCARRTEFVRKQLAGAPTPKRPTMQDLADARADMQS